mgnify:FL=1
MSDLQVSRIKVGKFAVGVIGIKELMEKMAAEYADKDNKEIQQYMLEQLGKNNYIPAGAGEEYGKAFVREFRKFMGQPCEEEASGEIDIKVLGPGCPQCDQLEKTLMELLSELNLPAAIEHVRDMKEIARYRIMSTPALLINGKVLAKGTVPAKDKIKKWLTEAAAAR